MTWDLLIAHIPHRHDELVRLLDTLEAQMKPGVGVLIYADNLEARYGAKCQALVQASTADYVSHISNDDLVAPDFIAEVLAALETEPDYVGFEVRFTEKGELQVPVYHSLRYTNWVNGSGSIYRDIVHFNPMRRELAQRVVFREHLDADRLWATGQREMGGVNTEVYIDKPMLYYQHDDQDTFMTPREPMPEAEIPDLPRRPFVRYIP